MNLASTGLCNAADDCNDNHDCEIHCVVERFKGTIWNILSGYKCTYCVLYVMKLRVVQIFLDCGGESITNFLE